MVFYEKQFFTQWWLWLILLAAITPLFLIALYRGPVLSSESEYSMVEFLIIVSCCLLPFIFLKLMFLETRMDAEGIEIRFFPLLRKSWSWDDIRHAEVLQYGFVGGWGIRLWTAYGTVYNIRGDQGLFFELHNGKKRLIGTQKQEEMKQFLDSLNAQNSVDQ